MNEIEYHQRSISELVTELEDLGQQYKVPQRAKEVKDQFAWCDFADQQRQQYEQIITESKKQNDRLVVENKQLRDKLNLFAESQQIADIYAVCERERLLLEMKLSQAQNDLIIVTKDSKENDLKNIIRRLTLQLQHSQKNITAHKIVQSKVLFLEKLLEQERIKRFSSQQKQQQQTQIKISFEKKNELLQLMPQQTYLFDKLSDKKQILENKYKSILVQCKRFLLQLINQMQKRFNKNHIDLVLDCNKFIRTFLFDNLQII